MRHATTTSRHAVHALALLILLLGMTNISSAQSPPNLGTASTYGVFSGNGAIGNTGLTMVTGDIGTYVGAFTGFPPGQYTGAKHVADAAALSAKNDLTLGYNSMNDATHIVIYDTALNSTMGNGQVLTPRTYGRGDLTTLSGNLTFDAQGNSNAVFIVKIGAALNVSAFTHILLANGAQAANIFWAVNGAVSILDNSIFKGTITSNGAIHLYGGSTLEGRALAVVGAVTLASNLVSIPGSAAPGNTLIVVTPGTGDTIKGGTKNYHITWAGTGITRTKSLDYSLDSGASWSTIGTITTDSFSFNWNAPDTASTRALIRIIDQNNVRGTSGLFTIVSGKIVVGHPSPGEFVTGGTQNYQITWTGTTIAPRKTIELSLDNGLTWQTIGTLSSSATAFNWNVPDTAAQRALIRVTDSSGFIGTSSVFTIRSSKVTVGHPALGESIAANTQNYQITWGGIGLTSRKTIDLSLDGGSTWRTIGTTAGDVSSYNWNVPDTASSQALIRVTDTTGITGRSGVFTIRSSKIMVTAPTAATVITGGTKNYRITWTGIGLTTKKTLEYSLDGGFTWNPIGTMFADVNFFDWNVPDTASTRSVVRITDQNGITGQTGLFTIKSGRIVVVAPAAGETVMGGTQYYRLTWTGAGLSPQKTFSLSLDGGTTWKTVSTITADVNASYWNVPDTTSTMAVIRITDSSGITGMSGTFTILSSKPPVGTIVVLHPTAGEVINGGTTNFPITFTSTNATSVKTFEYSLDGGTSWNVIGVMNSESQTYLWSLVPNVATTMGLVRITDANGAVGTSGLFTINVPVVIGTIDGLTLTGLDGMNNIANNAPLGISWAFTPDVGTWFEVEYALDSKTPWNHIATVFTSESPRTTWMTPMAGYFGASLIRVTSSKGMTRTSAAFSIGSIASVASGASNNGYAVSNYPNPVRDITTFNVTLPIAGNIAVTIIDGLGRKMGTIGSRHFNAGHYDIPFNTSTLAPGMYAYEVQIVAESEAPVTLVGRMNVVK